MTSDLGSTYFHADGPSPSELTKKRVSRSLSGSMDSPVGREDETDEMELVSYGSKSKKKSESRDRMPVSMEQITQVSRSMEDDDELLSEDDAAIESETQVAAAGDGTLMMDLDTRHSDGESKKRRQHSDEPPHPELEPNSSIVMHDSDDNDGDHNHDERGSRKAEHTGGDGGDVYSDDVPPSIPTGKGGRFQRLESMSTTVAGSRTDLGGTPTTLGTTASSSSSSSSSGRSSITGRGDSVTPITEFSTSPETAATHQSRGPRFSLQKRRDSSLARRERRASVGEGQIILTDRLPSRQSSRLLLKSAGGASDTMCMVERRLSQTNGAGSDGDSTALLKNPPEVTMYGSSVRRTHADDGDYIAKDERIARSLQESMLRTSSMATTQSSSLNSGLMSSNNGLSPASYPASSNQSSILSSSLGPATMMSGGVPSALMVEDEEFSETATWDHGHSHVKSSPAVLDKNRRQPAALRSVSVTVESPHNSRAQRIGRHVHSQSADSIQNLQNLTMPVTATIGLTLELEHLGVVALTDVPMWSSEIGVLQWMLDLDHRWSGWFHRAEWGRLDYLILPGAMLFNVRCVIMTLLMSLVLIDSVGAWMWLNLCCVLTMLVTQLVKAFCRRPRPHGRAIGTKKYMFDSSVKTFSFPSGDTSCCAMYAVCCCLAVLDLWMDEWPIGNTRNICALSMLVLIPYTAFGRVYFGCHYWIDTAVGALLGAVVAILLFWLIRPRAAHSFFSKHRLSNVGKYLS